MNVIMVLVFLLPMYVSGISTTSYNDVKHLKTQLLEDYSTIVRPVQDQKHTVNVSIAFNLYSIMSFDEISGEFSVSGVLKIRWVDEILVWSMNSVPGIGSILMPSSKVWVPKIYLANGVKDTSIYNANDDTFDVEYFYDGTAQIKPVKILQVFCEADMTYFPNDIHECKIELATHIKTRYLSLTTVDPKIDIRSYQRNVVWTVKRTWTTVFNEPGTSIVTYHITIARRPTFLYLTLVLPIIAMNFMNLLVFHIPVDYGERISYSITVLLTFAVYLSLYADKTPPTSNSSSVFSVSILTKLCTSCTIAMLAIISSKLNSLEGNVSVPAMFYKLFANPCRKNKVHDTQKTAQESDVKHPESKESVKIIGLLHNSDLGLSQEDMTDSHTSMTNQVSWKDVVLALDRAFFVLFTITLIVETSYSLTRIVNHS